MIRVSFEFLWWGRDWNQKFSLSLIPKSNTDQKERVFEHDESFESDSRNIKHAKLQTRIDFKMDKWKLQWFKPQKTELLWIL